MFSVSLRNGGTHRNASQRYPMGSVYSLVRKNLVQVVRQRMVEHMVVDRPHGVLAIGAVESMVYSTLLCGRDVRPLVPEFESVHTVAD